jgi:hypothetical protein
MSRTKVLPNSRVVSVALPLTDIDTLDAMRLERDVSTSEVIRAALAGGLRARRPIARAIMALSPPADGCGLRIRLSAEEREHAAIVEALTEVYEVLVLGPLHLDPIEEGPDLGGVRQARARILRERRASLIEYVREDVGLPPCVTEDETWALIATAWTPNDREAWERGEVTP